MQNMTKIFEKYEVTVSTTQTQLAQLLHIANTVAQRYDTNSLRQICCIV